MGSLFRAAAFLFTAIEFGAGVEFARAEGSFPEWISGKAILDHHESIGPARTAGTGTLQSGATVYGVATPTFGENSFGKLALRGSAFRRSLDHGSAFVFRGSVQEAWAGHAHRGFEIRLGQIVTPWGRSDAVNPTDFLLAKDLTFLSIHDEIRRRGAPGLRASWVPQAGVSPLEFTFAYSARYPQTEMLIPASAVPTGIDVQTRPDPPAWFQDHQEFAFKAAYLAPGWDVSISAFDGRMHFGQFIWTGNRVVLSYEKMRAMGTDFSVTFSDFVLRGEAATYFYGVGKGGRAGHALTEPNHTDVVLGVERAFTGDSGDSLRLILQGLYRVHPSLRDPGSFVGANPVETAIGRGVGQANALIHNYQDKTEFGTTLLAAYTLEQGWTFELGVLGNFIGGDFVLRPKARRKIADSLNASLGLDYYGGPAEKTLGALRDYRSVYADLTLAF